MAFAIQNGNFSSGSTWDTGIVPSGSEDAYANGFTIQVDGTRSLSTIRNTASDYYLPNTAIPIMASATSPSGIVTTSSQQPSFEGWRAFDRNISTLWATVIGVTSASIVYQFTSTKIIKRYMFRNTATAGTGARSFTFDGSNDGISWTTLDTQSTVNVGALGIFTSGLLANTTAYLYYRLNVLTVNGATSLNMTEIEMTESTSTSVGQILGGTFSLTSGSNLTCTAALGVVVGSITPPITFTLPSGSTATVNANIPSITTVTSYAAVLLNGLGTLNFNGNISCLTSTSNLKIINITAAGTLNYNGNCTNIGNTPNTSNSIFSSAAATINIITTGFAGGSFALNLNASVYMSAGGNLTITGNISGGLSPAVLIVGGSANVIGNVTASSTAPAIQNITITTPIIDITGIVTAGSGANAVVGLGLVRLSGLYINNNRFNAIYSPQTTIESTTTSMTYQKFAGTDQIMYIGSSGALGQPATNNVRFGTVYGAASEFTGTLVVPNPSTVLLGVATDATVGTLLMTPDQFIAELGVNTRPIAQRLQNASTVATTGDQIAAYNV
jgi:hypothetical protein